MGLRNQPLQSVNPESFQFNYTRAFLYDESFTLSSLNNTAKNNPFFSLECVAVGTGNGNRIVLPASGLYAHKLTCVFVLPD